MKQILINTGKDVLFLLVSFIGGFCILFPMAMMLVPNYWWLLLTPIGMLASRIMAKMDFLEHD